MASQTLVFVNRATGDSTQSQRHQNPDGSLGGFVALTAVVDETATVETDAFVEPGAQVLPNATVRTGTIVRAGTTFG